MELHPSQSEDVIITLRTVELDLAPPYEAISYVWGDPNFKVGITCEGRSLQVTPNLKAVLHHLRPESGTEQGFPVQMLSALIRRISKNKVNKCES
jgi:hypothetical protein